MNTWARHQQQIRKMTPGTFGGQSRVATPVANIVQVGDHVSAPPATNEPLPTPALVCGCLEFESMASVGDGYGNFWAMNSTGDLAYLIASPAPLDIELWEFSWPGLVAQTLIADTFPETDTSGLTVGGGYAWIPIDSPFYLKRVDLSSGVVSTFTTITHPTAGLWSLWTAIYTQGYVWLLYYADDNTTGIVRVNPTTAEQTFYPFVSANKELTTYAQGCEASDGAFWIGYNPKVSGGGYGLARFDPATATWTSTTSDAVDQYAAPKAGDDGSVYAISYSGGHRVVVNPDMTVEEDTCTNALSDAIPWEGNMWNGDHTTVAILYSQNVGSPTEFYVSTCV